MNIRLPNHAQQGLDISYDTEIGIANEICSTLKSCFREGGGSSSRISQYQHRMNSSREYWQSRSRNKMNGSFSSSTSSPNRRNRRKSCLLSLDELYAIKGRFSTSRKKKKQQKVGSSMFIYIIVSFFVSLEIMLLFRLANKILWEERRCAVDTLSTH